MTESLSPDQIFIRKLKEIVLANLNRDDFGADELASVSGMSHSGLYRKLNKITNKTISQFIREVRLEKALEILTNESLTAAEVSYKVGFSSPAYFNTCFHEFFGYPPGKVKKHGNDQYEESFHHNEHAVDDQKKSTYRSIVTPYIWVPVIAVLVVLLVYPVYRSYFKRNSTIGPESSDERISVVVLPFKNMTSDTVWNFWEEGIQTNIITSLSNSNEFFEVRQAESVKSLLQSINLSNYASITPAVASTISKKLKTDYFVFGNIQQAGARIRLSAQLIDSKSGIVLKPFEIDGPAQEEMIFAITDSLRRRLTDFLIISLLKKDMSPDFKIYEYTNSPEAYRNFINGNNAVMRGDPATAIALYMRALAIDSNFIVPAIFASSNYPALGKYEDAKKWCLKAYSKRDMMPLRLEIMANWAHANLFGTPQEALKYLLQDLEFDDQLPIVYWLIGNTYSEIFQYDKAIPYLEKSLALYEEWDVKPSCFNYTSLGFAYHKTGKYGKEKRLYRKAENEFSDHASLLFRQAILELSEGDFSASDRIIEGYVSNLKENSASEAIVAASKGIIYKDAGILDRAEEYYWKALTLEPDNPVFMNNLAYFLIDYNRDLDEGLRLASASLTKSPANHNFLHTRGWGLFKINRYEDALDTLLKSWDLRMKNATYNHEAFIHLEEARKAIAKPDTTTGI